MLGWYHGPHLNTDPLLHPVGSMRSLSVLTMATKRLMVTDVDGHCMKGTRPVAGFGTMWDPTG